ncbi:EAL domain-containing protein [Enterobacter sp. BIDMC 26]|uniref:EAL domain-containing protein n=1 Tax=Enterobacter sp. BIDMC 26 TaxID=1329838 RepID=UPI0004512BBA|nr:EAL domain-containing protein [Enterobacter sp. BIDMC 26]EUM24172.1 hypothetical protein L462_04257 [Enterobacter sp. BIDMC 26]
MSFRTGRQYFFSILIGAGIFFAGVGTMYYDFVLSLNNRILSTTKQAMGTLEEILHSASTVALQSLQIKPLHCASNVNTLRQFVALGLYVRSVSLVRNGTIYCSTLYGDVNFPDISSEYVSQRLLLMEGNTLNTHRPLLVLRQNGNTIIALVGVDAQYLVRAMTLQDKDIDLLLIVGGTALSRQGKLLTHFVPRSERFSLILPSGHYPVSVQSSYPTEKFWHEFLRLNIRMLICLFLLSCGVAFLTKWLSTRPHSLRDEIKRALERHEFIPYFQPIFESDTERCIGAEVLIRWHHPRDGIIFPDCFIPQAESSGMIVPVTAGLMQDVAKTLRSAGMLLPEGFHIGINISPQHITDPAFSAHCRSFLQSLSHRAITLVLELTEREPLQLNTPTLAQIADLQMAGVIIAIDDFGTGHSSLSYLQAFRVDTLKIDRSFISKMVQHAPSENVIDNIVDLSQRLSLQLVAEGVETEEQARLLRKKGVHLLQGFYYGRPQPWQQFVSDYLLTAERSREQSDSKATTLPPAPKTGCP